MNDCFSSLLKIPDGWQPYVHLDKSYCIWVPPEWSITSPLSKGSCFALLAPDDEVFMEVFVLGAGPKAISTAEVESVFRIALLKDHPDMQVIREGPYQLDEVDASDALSRMNALSLVDGYGFVKEMCPSTCCYRLTVAYAEKARSGLGKPPKTTTDGFFLGRGDLVVVLNMKTLSFLYAKWARTFEQIAANAKLGRFA